MLAVYGLLGFAMGATFVSGTLIALEFSAPARRPTYVGVANTGTGAASAIAPLLGGGMAALGYPWLFGLSAAVGAAALLWLLVGVRDPRYVTAAAPDAQVVQIAKPETT
jgi:MFS family permease